MNATLESARVETQQTASIEINGITFAGKDPCRPKYNGFYRGPHSGPVQLEPAFQVGNDVEQLKVTLGLESSDGIVFVEDPDPERPDRPLCRVLDDKDFRPDIEFSPGDRTSCILTWKRLPDAPVTRVFRVYCKPKGGEPSPEQKVHGGLFLAFITYPLTGMGREIEERDPGNQDRGRIHLTGADRKHRPLYDLHELKLPEDLDVELEPAYRVRRSVPFQFEAIIHIEDAVWGDELTFLQPTTKPDELCVERLSPTAFGFGWNGTGTEEARITTFHLQPIVSPEAVKGDFPESLLALGWTGWDEYAAALQKLSADPTIIQPPSCDPVYNVCSG